MHYTISKQPIKNNMTVRLQAEKYHTKNKIPLVILSTETALDRVENARIKLMASSLAPAQKVARLAKIAEKEHTDLRPQFAEYHNSLIEKKKSFEATALGLTKPIDSVSAIQQSVWSSAILQAGKGAPDLARSCPEMASAALQMPEPLRHSVGLLDDNVLLEASWEGYTSEINRYNSLIENSERLMRDTNQKLGALHGTTMTTSAVQEMITLESL